MKRTKSVIAVALSIACGMSACNREPQSNAATEIETAGDNDQVEFKSLEDRFSYAYGLDLATKFKAEGIALNVAQLAAAMDAVFKDGEKKMSVGEVAATMQMFREVHLKEKEERTAAAAEKNKREGEPFLKENAKKDDVIVTKSGLQYKVIVAGKGGKKPSADDEVKVHYRARFIDGTEFDNTYTRGEPYSVNSKMLIDGWAEALQLMSEGSKWELYIPANLAYGEKGSEPHIGPNAVLIFEVELLEILKQS